MHHQTQIEAWQNINDNGLLGRLQLAVLTLVYNSDGITQGEALKLYNDEIGVNNSGSVSTRFSELERMGVIESIGTRACKVTGNNCLQYVFTGKLPIKPEKKPKKADQVKKGLQLCDEVEKKFHEFVADGYWVRKEIDEIREIFKSI